MNIRYSFPLILIVLLSLTLGASSQTPSDVSLAIPDGFELIEDPALIPPDFIIEAEEPSTQDESLADEEEPAEEPEEYLVYTKTRNYIQYYIALANFPPERNIQPLLNAAQSGNRRTLQQVARTYFPKAKKVDVRALKDHWVITAESTPYKNGSGSILWVTGPEGQFVQAFAYTKTDQRDLPAGFFRQLNRSVSLATNQTIIPVGSTTSD